jgi:hypothetical protein
MKQLASEVVARFKYGQPVIVVSGLPRSGTSMLMNMLASGGMPVVTDEHRRADEDNPLGYFELDRVKSLETDRDRVWVRAARGKAIKVVSHLLRFLPNENRYRLLLATRDLSEVLTSQNRMLSRLNRGNPLADEKAIRLYERHLRNVLCLVRVRSNFDLLVVPYAEVVADAQRWSRRIASFVGGSLDEARMAAVVRSKLYRNRAQEGAVVLADGGASK